MKPERTELFAYQPVAEDTELSNIVTGCPKIGETEVCPKQ
jgi:hypothetical protein